MLTVNQLNIITTIILCLVAVAAFIYAVVKGFILKDQKGRTHFRKHRKSKKALTIADYIWRKQYKALLWVIGSLGLLIVVLLDNKSQIGDVPPKDELTAGLLFITAVIIFWYTRETYDQKKISQGLLSEQRKEAKYRLRPILAFSWHSGDATQVFQINNWGEGAAINVEFTVSPLTDSGLRTLIGIKSRPIIATAAPSTIDAYEIHNSSSGQLGAGGTVPALAIKGYLDSKISLGYSVRIEYEDIEGNKYFINFKADSSFNDRFRVTEQGELKKEKK